MVPRASGSFDMLACSDALARSLGDAKTGLFSLEMWGGANLPSTAMRFLSEDPLGTPAPEQYATNRTSAKPCSVMCVLT
jgi:hypothetical protein